MLPRYNERHSKKSYDKYNDKIGNYTSRNMFYWQKVHNFVDMKTSIDFLPDFVQRDLHQIVALIQDEIHNVGMIILFGSYAKGTFVRHDVTKDYGGGLIEFNSDYDILVVSKKRLGKSEGNAETRIRDRFARGKDENEVTKIQLISESISKLNNALSEGRYFYVEAVNEGIMLYDNGEYTLATPQNLNYAEIEKQTLEYYNTRLYEVERHFRHLHTDYSVNDYTFCAFDLHQVTEHLIKAVILVCTLYGYKEHDLEFLLGKVKEHTKELHRVFPRNSKEEKHLFDLLRRAYLEARYNPKFVVTKDEVDALLLKIERLKQIVETVCRERIAYYASQIKK